MEMKGIGVKTKLLLAVLMMLVCLGVWVYASGAVLFLEYRESPLKASWKTIYQAWVQSANNEVMHHKVVKALQIGGFIALAISTGIGFAIASFGSKKELHGSARFATHKEIKDKGLFAEEGIVLGRFGKDLIRFGGSEFVLLAAPTRSGKGVGFVIPNLLMWKQSAVVLDIKGENYDLTSAYRKEILKQDIFIFNPFSENTHRCNFLTYVASGHDRINDLQTMAATIYPLEPGGKAFFVDTARNLFVGITLMILETPGLPHTFGEILRQGSGKGQALNDYLESVVRTRASSAKPLSNVCVDCLTRFTNLPEETLGNVLASFTAPLSIFMNPVIDKATSGNDFDLRDVRKNRMTVYLNIPADKVTAAPFILNLFFTMLIQVNTKELPEKNPTLKYSCMLLMDEFTAAGRIEMVEKGVGFIAGYGLRLVIIIQDRAQLSANRGGYGKEAAQNIINNMGASIYFTPNTEDDAKALSAMIGNETMRHENIQRSNIGLSGGTSSRSASEQLTARALMLPQELRLMSEKRELITRTGISVIDAQKIVYYEDPEFKERLGSTSQTTKTVDGKSRRVPIPVPLPDPCWKIFHSAVLRSDYYVDGDTSDLGALASAN